MRSANWAREGGKSENTKKENKMIKQWNRRKGVK
jgi:hypothetical protein